MEKYNIVNKARNQIVCKAKNNDRHYRQNKDAIEKGLSPVCTTKGRAEKEAAYLNREYYEGWEIVEALEEWAIEIDL